MRKQDKGVFPSHKKKDKGVFVGVGFLSNLSFFFSLFKVNYNNFIYMTWMITFNAKHT